MPFTNVFSKQILDAAIRGATFTPPGTWYLGFSTTTPDGTGAAGLGGITEPSTSGTGYARTAITNDTSNFPAATGTNNATKSNTNAINTIPMATGAGWGGLTHWFFADAATVGGGNVMIFGALNNSPRTINANDTPSFAAGALTFTLT